MDKVLLVYIYDHVCMYCFEEFYVILGDCDRGLWYIKVKIFIVWFIYVYYLDL